MGRRIYCVSDLHSEYKQNQSFLQNISPIEHKKDTIIVAGDVNAKVEQLRKDLTLLVGKFSRVFYVPGNHDLWVGSVDNMNSIEKFDRILLLCHEIGVETKPSVVNDDVRVFPLFSWYCRDLIEGTGDQGVERIDGWSDDYFCTWPNEDFDPVQYFLDLNEKNISALKELPEEDRNLPIISCSHFLPRRELMPITPWLRHPGLLTVMGSRRLESQIREINSTVHVFGHSHISCDKNLDGIRYVQNAIRYPRERDMWGVTARLEEIWESPT